MNSHFNAKEFEILIENLKESNPEMSETELIELASLVHNIQEIPEVDAPKGLFEKVNTEINNQASVENISRKTRENKTNFEISWLDQFVSSLQSYLLPFSSGAVAMLVVITVFDFPTFNSNDSEVFQSNAVYEDLQTAPADFGSSKQKLHSPPQDSQVQVLAQVQQSSENLSRSINQKATKKIDSRKSTSRRKIVKVERKKQKIALKAMGMDQKKSQTIAEPTKPGPVRSSMMASLSAKRDDWIPRKSELKRTRAPQAIDGVMPASEFSPVPVNISGDDSLSSLSPSSEESLHFESDKSPIKKAVGYREALELHWKVSLDELKNARRLIKDSFSDVNRIRHLVADDLDDYSEISGQILADSFFLNVDSDTLKDLVKKADKLGSFWIPDRSNPKLFESLKDYLVEHSSSNGRVFDVQLKLIING